MKKNAIATACMLFCICILPIFVFSQTDSKIRAIELLAENRVRQELKDQDNSRKLKTVIETITEKDSVIILLKIEYNLAVIYRENIISHKNDLLKKEADYNAIAPYDSLMAKKIKIELDQMYAAYKYEIKIGNEKLVQLEQLNTAADKANPKKIMHYYVVVILVDKKPYDEHYTSYTMKFTPDVKIYEFKKDDD